MNVFKRKRLVNLLCVLAIDFAIEGKAENLTNEKIAEANILLQDAKDFMDSVMKEDAPISAVSPLAELVHSPEFTLAKVLSAIGNLDPKEFRD